MQLYSFFNSSTSYRVRIALALKGLPAAYHGVNIRTGEHRAADYAGLNAARVVPTLMDGDFALGQSMAILDYLDQRHPEPRLIPLEPGLRARVLELANVIACDMHPVNNLRILKYLQGPLALSAAQKDAWYAHWAAEGFEAVERLLARHGGEGPWCFGDAPTLADVCLVPQVANALRAGCDLAPYQRVRAVHAHAQQHPAFIAARPQAQPDYQP
ncbi:maleylacetoacetate isomerase [Paracidovorax cattleyae]|uniref:Maleylacetoacetate isomerase n=1 Tax=Paracidovorax cattleyae TaxID=80868 RepID=A0A1H0VH30_9BURK|nr:maleylacetoacetate isomerase [Paracidovorax cattleyae]MBF9266506.1 maleylacetoacetate isomerase [Paracidovorax cattleyae]SDP77653.1 maleylacetoacetate isomerase [Paracidovorax cattleyae]